MWIGSATNGNGQPIPARLNLVLSLAVSTTALGLLAWAAHAESWRVKLPVAAAFSFVMLTNYALLHEAEHEMLFPNRFWNRAFGTWHGWLFPSSFTLLRTTHLGHHRRNRTDSEMFDMYGSAEPKWMRTIQWYGILLGLFWMMAPIGAVLMSLRPPGRFLPLFTWARTTKRWVTDFQTPQVRAIRLETASGILAWISLWKLLGLSWPSVLICYALSGINWSTRQYIEHAFTERDVIEGTLNLRCARWLSCLILNQEWHLNHHRQPKVPWIHLPRLPTEAPPELSYGRAYLRLWRGPRLTSEPAPAALPDVSETAPK